MIRFRLIDEPPQIVDGVRIDRWQIASDENELFAKLNGRMAEVIMPAKPWWVRLWRMFFPLRGVRCG
jgi:hypothetical protein